MRPRVSFGAAGTTTIGRVGDPGVFVQSRARRDVPQESHRQYNCARCHCLVRICSSCDRGNRYCFDGCSEAARRDAVRRAGAKYQRETEGARAHAARQEAYRARQAEKEAGGEKVTHQGPPEGLPGASVEAVPVAVMMTEGNELCSIAAPVVGPPRSFAGPVRCDGCGCECARFARSELLTRRAPLTTRVNGPRVGRRPP